MAAGEGRRGRGGWWFLAVMLGVYALLGLGDAQAAVAALAFFVGVLGQLIPVLALVFILLLVADLLLDERRIRRYLGAHSGIQGWMAAVLGGVVSMGPIYPWYAMLGEMRARGMRPALISAFLYSRALKLPLLPLMAHYFGLAYTVAYACFLLLFAVINAIVLERLRP